MLVRGEVWANPVPTHTSISRVICRRGSKILRWRRITPGGIRKPIALLKDACTQRRETVSALITSTVARKPLQVSRSR
jgi:hypothetical protein